eukprot:3770830-Prorocentrum_lima.AAC.1
MANHLIGHHLERLLNGLPQCTSPLDARAVDVVAGVNFIVDRYLYGQAVVAQCCKESYWLTYNVPPRWFIPATTHR